METAGEFFWVVVLCYRIRLTLEQLSLARGMGSSESGPDKRNRSMLFASSQPIPIVNQMNQSEEQQIATAYNKSIKEFEQNPHQLAVVSHTIIDDPANKFEIACIAGPVSEKVSREIFEICKDRSRGKSHSVAALTLEAKRRSIRYECNLRALYAVECDEILIEEINHKDADYIKCSFINYASSSSSSSSSTSLYDTTSASKFCILPIFPNSSPTIQKFEKFEKFEKFKKRENQKDLKNPKKTKKIRQK